MPSGVALSDLLTQPRFWSEEGRYHYEALQTSRWSVFTLVVRGNFQLITNFGVAIATLVPAVWAPAVTTYFGTHCRAHVSISLDRLPERTVGRFSRHRSRS